jgi:tetracycline 7-halogenase / FADH2 O2-dependent halogenase
VEPDPHEATQLAIPKFLPQASHLFRQDSDSYMFHVAARYGCTTRQNWRAVDIDLDEDGVTVTGQNGEMFRGRYLIDASGFRSPLADKLDLRETPARFKHHSRSLFNHYIGVKPFDEVSRHPVSRRPPSPWHQGTLHHLIERGWFWIIPFDNHKDSRNPLCSVGLTFDERTYPKPTDLTPEEEFNYYLARYPAIKRQFEGAHKVREWVSTDRLQYSSKQSVGYRWCLMSHAAGFIDPLYSRGLSNTFEVVNALMYRILGALKDDDFSVERFRYVEELERGLLHYNDELVNSSFIAFSNFELWNAVFRVWGFSTTLGGMRLARARLRYQINRDDQVFRDLEKTPYTGLWLPESDRLKELLESTAEACEKYEAGVLDASTAAESIFALIQDSDIVDPAFGWKDPDQHFIDPSTLKMVKFMYWASTQGAPEMRHFGVENLRSVVKVASQGHNPL